MATAEVSRFAFNPEQIVAWPHESAWVDARSSGIGASEIAAACGLLESRSPLDIYCIKRGIKSDNLDDIEYVQAGKWMEPAIKAWFCHRAGLKLAHETCPMLRHPLFPEIFATPDGIVDDGNVLETKNINDFVASKWLGEELTDHIKPEWTAQTQIQMEVVGCDMAHVAVCIGGHKLRIFQVERNQRFIDLLIAKARELWQRILAGEPPAVDPSHDSVSGLIKAMYPTVSEGDVIELPPDCATKWMEAQSIDNEIKRLEKQRDGLKNSVKLEMRDAHVARFPGCEFELVRSVVNVKEHERKAGSYVKVTQRKARNGHGT